MAPTQESDTNLGLWGLNVFLFAFLFVLFAVIALGAFRETGSFSQGSAVVNLGFYGWFAFVGYMLVLSTRKYRHLSREAEGLEAPSVGIRGSRKMTARTFVFVGIILLYPYPVGLLLALGVPFGWTYYAVYAAWALFGVLLAWLILRHRPAREPRWPHVTAMKVLLAAALLWVFFINFFPHLVSPVVGWFVAAPLTMGWLLEFAVVMGVRRGDQDRVPGH